MLLIRIYLFANTLFSGDGGVDGVCAAGRPLLRGCPVG
jgi:hypothetical protein